MITKPMSVYPNNNAIDGSIENTFEMEIKTSGDTVVYYQIEILDATTGDSIFLGSKTATTKYNGDFLNIIVAADSFDNGLDLNWQATLWSPASNMLVVNGVTQEGSTTTAIVIRQHESVEENMVLKIGSETRTITDYDYDTAIATVSPAFSEAPAAGVSYTVLTNFIHTPLYFFKSRTTPVVTFDSIDNPITLREYDFAASYAQAEGTNIKYFIFNLYDEDDEIIDTTNQVYTSNLTYSFDGFLSGDYSTLTPRVYKLELIVNNQDDVEIIEELAINVLYPAPSIKSRPTIEFLEEEGGVQVSWSKNLQSIGIADGPYTFISDFPFAGTTSIILPEGTTIIYNEVNGEILDITEESTLIASVNLDANKQGKIIGMTLDDDSEIYVTLEGYDFTFVKDGNETILKSIFSKYLTCFQDYDVPLSDTAYMLYNDATWDLTKNYVVSDVNLGARQYIVTLNNNTGYVKEV